MPYRQTFFVNNNFYHIFNRGVEKRIIFKSNPDYQRFLATAYYYQFAGPKPKFSTHTRFRQQDFHAKPRIVEIVCYCLMPNHFHLILRQLKTNGIQEFMKKVLNSYTKYFNTKYKRSGHLFQGAFKDVPIEKDEHLLHLSRYIHLNPYAAGITNKPEQFAYSSYQGYLETPAGEIAAHPILQFFKTTQQYKQFARDQKDYARNLETIKHLLIEEE